MRNGGSPIITLNTSTLADFTFLDFRSKFTARDAAITLLQELGHVYSAVFGPSSTTIQDDNGRNTALTTVNTAKVKEACFN